MVHPERLGKYPITGVLGEGAMGVVYRARDPVIERELAIKTVHKRLLAESDDSSGGASFAERFRNEARSAGRLAHPNIVPVYEYGEDGEIAYIVMAYAPGRTLAQQLAETPLPPLERVLHWTNQLLDALGHAHRHGVWHRDIKPANLIVGDDGRLLVTDFGIARIASAALTQTGSALGTPGYMAPEQYVGEGIDERVDLFAAGVVLYRLLAGRPPFTGTAEAVMYQIFHETPVAPSRVAGAGRDARFDAIVAKAMARDPAARYASAGDFAAALAAAAAQAPDDTTVVLPAWTPPPAAAPQAVATPATGGGTLPPGLVDHATRVLTSHMGPIARIVVKKAAGKALTREEFFRLLGDEAGAAVDRARLLAELDRG
jgi:serine/threonine-protein kinase